MLRRWRRQIRLLFAVICTVGLGTTVFGQEPADGAAQPPATPPAAETPAAETPAAGDQPPAAQDPPAKTDQPPAETKAPAAPEAAKDDPAPAKPATPPAADPAAPAKPATPPAADPAAPSTQPPAPSADPAAAQAAFDAKMEEWKVVLKSLRALTPRYSLASEEEAAEIRKEWDETIARGELLIPQLRHTGMVAYAASRGGDRMVERFLVKLLTDDVTHDRFEMAHDLGLSLVSSGCEVKEVFDAAGLASFAINDLENAEILLNRAMDAGALSDKGREYLGLVEQYKEFWAVESALREKEAAANDLPRVKITTSVGDMVVELLENEAPETVGNFVYLVEEKKFYDGLSFHRVLPGFMAQGGCPNGNGSGGPGYMIKCETDAENHRKHFRGTLSMAHAGKNTGGSQFFLTFVPTAHLNGDHTVFGRVIEGMDVLERIQRLDPSKPGVPVEPDKIIKMEVLRKRDHEYKPNKSQ